MWRRHLAANADRLLAAGGGRATGASSPSGFADLVGYTSRSRGMGGRELGAMVEDFESTAAEVIARHAGRVVKTVGDGVLFTDRSAAVAGRRSGWSCPRSGTAEDRPPLRAGRGLRARCSPGSATSTHRWSTWPAGSPRWPGPARCWSTASWPSRLRDLPGYKVRQLHRVSVRGYDHLQPWLVRRRRPATGTTSRDDDDDDVRRRSDDERTDD